MSWILTRLKGDKMIWITVFMIVLVSVLALYSAGSARAYRIYGGDTEGMVLRHAFLLGAGLLIMFVVHLLNYRIFAKLSNGLLLVTIPLLIYTIASGSETNETARWISIFGTSFQPSDLAKITLMIYLAKLLTMRQDVIKDFTEGFLPALFWVTVICGLIAPSDLSTAMLMFIASVMVMFIAGVDVKYIGLLILVGVMGLGILNSTAKRSATWKARWDDYVMRMVDSDYTPNVQITQAHIAIATSGLLGKGVGKSAQRNYLPEADADYIYAIIIEEYGLMGGIFIVLLYLLLLFRSVSIATMSRTFGALMASGLAFILVLQAMINMGVTVGILPVTGFTLPLISKGGTSILITCISLGIILSVSRDAIENKGKKRGEGLRTQLRFT
ncbi:MAG: FtsW/RodA/SpoVE family cell cycle protein [Bacteroidia bacterium]|nr:FtsW/RodA/SpoVE family cell cycle protein [Bacteroidia bacterium]